MTSRQVTIFTCDRCDVEMPASTYPFKGQLWFRNDHFEVGSSFTDGVKDTVDLCDDCRRSLHDWWNKGKLGAKEPVS